MLKDIRSDLWGEECRTILPIGFDVGIQIVLNPKGVYKRIPLVVSVVLFTMVRTKCKDGGCAETESPRGEAKDLKLVEMSEWTSAGKARGPLTVDTKVSLLIGRISVGGKQVIYRVRRSFDKGSCRLCLCVTPHRPTSSHQC